MAEEKESKKDSKGGPETDLLTITVGLIFLGFIASSFFSNYQDGTSEGISETVVNSSEEYGANYAVPVGDLTLGKNIRNRKEVEVRSEPGGEILGNQSSLEKGILAEGPVENFGYSWWRVNYEEAPSGWVKEDDLTKYSFLILLLNSPVIFYKTWVPLATVLSIILILFIFYIILKRSQIGQVKKEKYNLVIKEEEEESIIANSIDQMLSKPIEPPKPKNPKWQNIQSLVQSNNSADWRQAIIEADIMLDKMVTTIGYEGETLAEKMKQIEDSDFLTINSAWEAHKVRNRIAHMGSDFILSRNEAQRVIKLYEEVFKEFHYI